MNNEILEVKVMEHDKRLDEHDKRFNKNEDKIEILEKSDVKKGSQIDNLCEKLEEVIATNNKIFYALLFGMAGILVKLLFFK